MSPASGSGRRLKLNSSASLTEPLLAWINRCRNDASTLAARLGDRAVLVYEPPADDEEDESTQTEYRYKTVSGVTPTTFGGGEPMVFLLTKTRDNAFQRRVTVGRTSNNDLPVEDPSVSRFHAWFQREDEDAPWFVVDAGSKNGTKVNGKALEKKKPHALTPGTRIRIGHVELSFFDSAGFIRMLKARM
jgi:pSer/pThr/pTyr-binding forkhead associated (FHA) protein